MVHELRMFYELLMYISLVSGFSGFIFVCVCGDIERATALWLDSGKWHDYKIKAAIDFNHCKSADYL